MNGFFERSEEERANLWAILALRHAFGIGPARGKLLIDAYGTPALAAKAGLEGAVPKKQQGGKRPCGTADLSYSLEPDAPHDETLDTSWCGCAGISPAVVRRFSSGAWREKARAEWEAVKHSDIRFLLYGEEAYPAVLAEIPDPPLILYYKGDISLLNGPSVAVVGARKCTHEGLAVAAFFSRGLSSSGVTVVSGMAQGIDRAAHIAALDGVGGSIAVLGSGVDVPYPDRNADVYAALARKGLILSEFAPGSPPIAAHFPIRNRIISGLSQGVLVVEAAARSGSLVTARLALEQNRDVFAVPGHTMASVSEGCRELVRRGATAVFCADDILEELAPLLSREAVKALNSRRIEREEVRRAACEGTPPECMCRGAEAVLPPGALPWLAPSGRAAAVAKAAALGCVAKPGRVPPASLSSLEDAPAAPLSPGASLKAVSAAPDVPEASLDCPETSRKSPQAAPGPLLSDAEQRVLEAVQRSVRVDGLHVDDIAYDAKMDVAQVSGLLTVLEVRGLVRRHPGVRYSRVE